MAIGDVYRVRDIQQQGIRQFSNVYWYRVVTATPAVPLAADFAIEWQNQVMAFIVNLQLTSIIHIGAEVVNMNNPLDYNLTPITVAGEQVGTNTPPFISFQYRFNRLVPGQRSGFKRYVGVPEEQMSGTVWQPTSPGDAYLLATALAATIETDDALFEPVIVGTPRELGANPPVSYRPVVVTPMQQITSQRNRMKSAGTPLPPP